ncbi:AaceriADL081Cp [[Ashbya] aceris (nom. inval.)]|nr:AaceriADL081Cp [[Ashbya] aceris (nom. inval.)]
MDLVRQLNDRLLFAVPKKGRLYEKSVALLNGADILFHRSHRLDIALSTSTPVALIFLPAADIPTFVGEGRCDLGITGVDQVRESGVDVELLQDLDFGRCKLQVQVPAGGPYSQPEQLIGKTIVTSFTRLAREYFARLEGVDEAAMTTRIKYVGGSVEAACALGVADAIVDLVESGETMRAAGLTPIGTVLSTSAHLIGSPSPKSSPALLDTLRARIEGVLAAQQYIYCTYNAHVDALPALLRITPGRRAPTISKLEDENWCAVSSMIMRREKGRILDDLKSKGAEDIMVFEISNCRV